jgi:hypothetical protein
VTASRLPERDWGQVDALVADRYLDALLDAMDRRAVDAPADAALDPALREAARVLRRSLVRVHPSFRFEERLAARLADLAASQSGAALAEAVAGGGVIPFPAPGPAPVATGAAAQAPARRVAAAHSSVAPATLDGDPLLDAILRGDLDPADESAMEEAAPVDAGPDRRPLIVVGGAAITSAAISLVGVAYVAWRASRPARPQGRAAGTAHARRAALAGASLGGPA